MTQAAWTHDGRPVDAASIPGAEWEALKQTAQLGDFVMPCCKAPAVLKTSINGLPFFAICRRSAELRPRLNGISRVRQQ